MGFYFLYIVDMETKFKNFKNITSTIDVTEEYEKVKDVEIVQITGIIGEDEAKKIDENFVVHAGDFTNKNVKRGDYVYLSCILKKPGDSYSPHTQGVLQCRVTDIYLGLSKLNSIIKK